MIISIINNFCVVLKPPVISTPLPLLTLLTEHPAYYLRLTMYDDFKYLTTSLSSIAPIANFETLFLIHFCHQ